MQGFTAAACFRILRLSELPKMGFLQPLKSGKSYRFDGMALQGLVELLAYLTFDLFSYIHSTRASSFVSVG